MGAVLSLRIRRAAKFLKPFEYINSPSQPFPLFRLPLLPLIEVFQCFNPIELYILAQCSKKACSSIPASSCNHFIINVDVGKQILKVNDVYTFHLAREDFKQLKKDSKIKNLEGFSMEYKTKLKRITFWDHNNLSNDKNLKTIVSSIKNAFKCPISSFQLFDWLESNQCWFSVLRYIVENQEQSLQSLELDGTFKQNDLRWVLKNAKVSGRISFSLRTMEHFTISNFHSECEQLEISPAWWIDVNTLMSLKSSRYIKLEYSDLTMKEMNIYMNKWKSGQLPKLLYMLILDYETEYSCPILGYQEHQLRESRDFGVSMFLGNRMLGSCSGGVEIQSDDGTKASIQMGRVFGGRSFEVFVWGK